MTRSVLGGDESIAAKTRRSFDEGSLRVSNHRPRPRRRRNRRKRTDARTRRATGDFNDSQTLTAPRPVRRSFTDDSVDPRRFPIGLARFLRTPGCGDSGGDASVSPAAATEALCDRTGYRRTAFPNGLIGWYNAALPPFGSTDSVVGAAARPSRSAPTRVDEGVEERNNKIPTRTHARTPVRWDRPVSELREFGMEG